MQTLIFNTTKKTAKLYSGSRTNGSIIEVFDNVPTVKVMDGYYEIMQKIDETTGTIPVFPVFRAPISNTNMIIEK
jgi:putative heme iron utilization protein